MIIVFATVTLKTGKNQELINVSKDLIKNTRLEEGCIDYNLYDDCESQDLFVFVEKWKDEKALNEHMETAHFKSFVEKGSPLFAKDLDIVQYLTKD
ncbi:MAG: antibiotic biosynthesis monooxygenase [Methanobrevibacter sp.]|jgi:quinol monooxygenase YgiN|nr:antibiotic biosynthesis monooxygenase [Candidatus Methanovirga meridionalis]